MVGHDQHGTDLAVTVGNGADRRRGAQGGAPDPSASPDDEGLIQMVDETTRDVRRVIPDEMEELAEGLGRGRRSVDVYASLDDEEPSLNQVLDAEEEAEEAREVAQDLESLQRLDPSFVTDPVKLYLREISHAPLLNHQQEIALAQTIERGNDAEQQLGRRDYASEGDRQQLLAAVEEGEGAMQTFVRSNLRLVVSIAKHYRDRGLPFLDLIQEGNLGLMRAVEKFDPQRGCRFSTYASWWIRQAIARAVADQGPTVRLPVYRHEQVGQLTRTAQRLQQSLERAPTAEELAHAVARPVAQVHTMQARHTPVLSLDAPLAEGEGRLGDIMADQTTLPPSEAALIAERAAQLEQCLQALTPREQAIVRARFGLDDGEEHTLEELGHGLQLSRQRVHQIEARALAKLRHLSRLPQLRGWANN